MDIETPDCNRRTFVRTSLGATAAATVAKPATAQDDPYNGWFDDVPNYEGTVDYSGEDELEVQVGTGDTGVEFEPPAIQVDPGTTVIWEWTGEGGSHNVVEENEVFESELSDEAGYTFEHTFEAEDDGEVFRYLCTPHEANNMFGAVAVGDVVDETISPPGEEDETVEEPGSDDGLLFVVGGIFAAALLSPVVFALFMKYVYEDDASQQPDH